MSDDYEDTYNSEAGDEWAAPLSPAAAAAGGAGGGAAEESYCEEAFEPEDPSPKGRRTPKPRGLGVAPGGSGDGGGGGDVAPAPFLYIAERPVTRGHAGAVGSAAGGGFGGGGGGGGGRGLDREVYDVSEFDGASPASTYSDEYAGGRAPSPAAHALGTLPPDTGAEDGGVRAFVARIVGDVAADLTGADRARPAAPRALRKRDRGEGRVTAAAVAAGEAAPAGRGGRTVERRRRGGGGGANRIGLGAGGERVLTLGAVGGYVGGTIARGVRSKVENRRPRVEPPLPRSALIALTPARPPASWAAARHRSRDRSAAGTRHSAGDAGGGPEVGSSRGSSSLAAPRGLPPRARTLGVLREETRRARAGATKERLRARDAERAGRGSPGGRSGGAGSPGGASSASGWRAARPVEHLQLSSSVLANLPPICQAALVKKEYVPLRVERARAEAAKAAAAATAAAAAASSGASHAEGGRPPSPATR